MKDRTFKKKYKRIDSVTQAVLGAATNSSKAPVNKPEQTDPAEKPDTKPVPPTVDAFEEYLDWKKENAPALKELDGHPHELSEQHPGNYRFTLERVRGAAKIKGVHSHT